ncbi:hypothetical protein F4604DRAFT_669737 [Suillus subluteus]|nr:hypothetical protein F4604DRAFT_669737 [Suillus subluteus]
MIQPIRSVGLFLCHYISFIVVCRLAPPILIFADQRACPARNHSPRRDTVITIMMTRDLRPQLLAHHLVMPLVLLPRPVYTNRVIDIFRTLPCITQDITYQPARTHTYVITRF